MASENIQLLSAPAGATQTSKALDCFSVTNVSFQSSFTDGTSAGTLQVQASNDLGESGATATNWTNVPSGSATVSAGAYQLQAFQNIAYRWMRVTWAPSGGAGTITVNAKGL